MTTEPTIAQLLKSGDAQVLVENRLVKWRPAPFNEQA